MAVMETPPKNVSAAHVVQKEPKTASSQSTIARARVHATPECRDAKSGGRVRVCDLKPFLKQNTRPHFDGSRAGRALPPRSPFPLRGATPSSHSPHTASALAASRLRVRRPPTL